MSPDEYIYYIHDYIPKNTGIYSKVSEQLLDYKRGKSYAINKFNYELLRTLYKLTNNKSLPLTNRTICTVPSHNAYQWSDSLKKTAEYLSNKTGMRNGYYFLRRTNTIASLHSGGDRDIDNHINSIDIKYTKAIRKRAFIIIDDITTTGNSLEACRQILENYGATNIRCIAIGKTKSSSSYYDKDDIFYKVYYSR